MTRTVSLITCMLGLLLAGCGDSSNPSDKSATPTPGSAQATATPKPGSDDGGTNSGGGKKKEKAPKTTELSKSQLEDARKSARALANCLRAADLKVSTDSNSPKSRVIKLGKGVVLRLTLDGSGADVYVGGTRKNTRQTARALKKKPDKYKGRILVLYDKSPSNAEKESIELCVSRENV